MPHLLVKKGSKTGTRTAVSRKQFRIGKNSDCDLVLADDGIARVQAEIRLGENGTWSIEDVGGGLFVDGVRTMRAKLNENTVIRFGSVILSFHDPKNLSGIDFSDACVEAEKGKSTAHGRLSSTVVSGEKNKPKNHYEHAVLEIFQETNKVRSESKNKSIVRDTTFRPIVISGVVVLLVILGVFYFGGSGPMKIRLTRQTVENASDFIQRKNIKMKKGDKGAQLPQVSGQTLTVNSGAGSGAGAGAEMQSPSGGSGSAEAGNAGDGNNKLKFEKDNASAPDASTDMKQAVKSGEDDATPTPSGKEGDKKKKISVEIIDEKPKNKDKDISIEETFASSEFRRDLYLFDKGHPEEAVGLSEGSMTVACYEPRNYPAYLDELAVFWEEAPWISSYHFVVYADEDEDGPEEEEIVYVSPVLITTLYRGWALHPLLENSYRTLLTTGRWIIGVMSDSAEEPVIGRFAAEQDAKAYSYIGGSDVWVVLPPSLFPMIRVLAYSLVPQEPVVQDDIIFVPAGSSPSPALLPNFKGKEKIDAVGGLKEWEEK